jgi:AP2-associated kinase
VLEVFAQIVRPVASMHALAPPVAHRDLKFENVLVARDGSLRLCDFGSASSHAGAVRDKADRNEQEDAILRYTTPHFRAPEMCDLFNGQPLDARSDVWALGAMLYGLAYYAHPFQDAGPLAILSARYRLPTSPAFPPPVHTIIRACLQYRPSDRPSAAQLGVCSIGITMLELETPAHGVRFGPSF